MASLRYQPPAVEYTLQHPVCPSCLFGALWLLAGGVLLAWHGLSGPVPLAARAGAWLCWWAAAIAMLQSWHTAPLGVLSWDGGAWWWQPLGKQELLSLQQVQVRLDVQNAMLVHWRTMAGDTHFAWLTQRSMPWRWGDWRRAVYSAATVSRSAEDGA